MAQKEKNAQVQEKDAATSDLMRKFKANPALFIGTVVVLVLVIVSFVLVPAIVPETGRGMGDFTFGYYDRVPISWVPGNYFAQYQEQIMRYYRNMIDPNDTQAGFYIWQQAFEAAAVHTAVLQEMKRSNYTVPVKIVDRQMAQLPQFQENGRFSPALYQQMPDTSRLALWRQVQDDLTKVMYYRDLFNLMTPENEADFIGKMSSNMKSFDAAIFLVDDYPASEYLEYAREHADLFGTIHLSRISVNSGEREARKILNSIKDGTTTFEDAAKEHSKDSFSDKGGDMGIRYIFDFESEVANAADRDKIFSLAKGELSDVFRVGASWAFFRVEDELKPADFEDNAVMERVNYYVRNRERGRMEDWAVSQALDFIADAQAAGFDEALRWRNKSKSSFGPLPVNYGNVDLFTRLDSFSIDGLSSQEITDMAGNENFWKTAFSAQLNAMSQPVVQGNKVLVFLTTEQIEADEGTAAEISSRYLSSWLNDTTDQSLRPYFMNSSKMDNRFREAYFRFVAPIGN